MHLLVCGSLSTTKYSIIKTRCCRNHQKGRKYQIIDHSKWIRVIIIIRHVERIASTVFARSPNKENNALYKCSQWIWWGKWWSWNHRYTMCQTSFFITGQIIWVKLVWKSKTILKFRRKYPTSDCAWKVDYLFSCFTMVSLFTHFWSSRNYHDAWGEV